jgi:hypothetical protein
VTGASKRAVFAIRATESTSVALSLRPIPAPAEKATQIPTRQVTATFHSLISDNECWSYLKYTELYKQVRERKALTKTTKHN